MAKRNGTKKGDTWDRKSQKRGLWAEDGGGVIEEEVLSVSMVDQANALLGLGQEISQRFWYCWPILVEWLEGMAKYVLIDIDVL